MVNDRKIIEKKLSEAANERERIDLLNHYGFLMHRVDKVYMDELIERALRAAKKAGYTRGTAMAITNRGYSRMGISGYLTALPDFEMAVGILEKDPGENKSGLIIARLGLAIALMQKGDYTQSADIYRKTLALSESAGAPGLQGLVYNNMSLLYHRLNDLKKALEYSDRACELLKKSKRTGSYLGALNNGAHYSYRLKKYSKALSLLDTAHRLIKDTNFYYGGAVMILTTSGEVYMGMGRYKKAALYFHKGLELAGKLKSPRDQVCLSLGLGDLFMKQNRLKKAKGYLKKAFNLSKKFKVNTIAREACKQLIRIYKKEGKFKKVSLYQSRFYRLMRRSYNSEANKKIRNVEADLLKKSNQRLKAISAIGQEIISNLNIREVLNVIYKSIHLLMDASVCGIANFNSFSGDIHFDMFIEDGKYLEPISRNINNERSFAAYCIRTREDILINDLEAEYGKFIPARSDKKFGGVSKHICSMIFTPLIEGEEVAGIVTVQSYKKNAYTLADLDSLKILSSYIVTALRNARQVEKEMEVAKKIQTAILPRSFANENFDIYGVMLPADHVGGDYFDFLLDPKKSEWFCIGDVTNHGLTPGLIMMMTQSIIKTIIEIDNGELTTERVINELNKILYDTIRNRLNIDEAMTISVFHHVGGGNIKTSGLHEDILIYREKTSSVEVIKTEGMWIGFLPHIDGITKTGEIFLAPRDVMLLYTDGLIESRNEKKELMKLQRIIDLFRQNGEKHPEEIAHTLLHSVQDFMASQADDITILVVKKR